jgi:3-mercaptopyruvate sulfurtransferase SseA
MTTLREAAQRALHTFESMGHEDSIFRGEFDQEITALRTALQTPPPPPEAQTEAEKNAYHYGWWAAMEAVRERSTEPVELTDEDIWKIFDETPETNGKPFILNVIRVAISRATGQEGKA